MDDIKDAYPDCSFTGAFEHKGTVCPMCGTKLTEKCKIACDFCGWTDF